ncbi:MlrC C-terminal domain-containing protein [Haladaptatus sp. CMAA 1911]|uniref:MlrC C-terminal domain-containing protein n=1 Tax=Haladaptatus sp. CMAA 1911 TaxID=3368987 RepID=UPI0037547600
MADNPGGGSAQDGTVLLEALLDAKVGDVVVATLIDPTVVDAVVEASVGERVTVELGGHIEDNGNPIEVEATVQNISDGTYRNKGPMSTGLEVTFGQTVVLECDGVEIIVGSHRQQPYDPEVFRAHDLQLERVNMIVLKSTVHYRAGFEPLVETIREVAAPGLCSPDLSRFEYDHIPRPLYPLDEDA